MKTLFQKKKKKLEYYFNDERLLPFAIPSIYQILNKYTYHKKKKLRRISVFIHNESKLRISTITKSQKFNGELKLRTVFFNYPK